EHLIRRVAHAAPALVGWIVGQAGPVTPSALGPDRARDEAAATVRADVVQGVLDTAGAERALVAADSRVRRGRRGIDVAQFAVRTQGKHGPDATAPGAVASLGPTPRDR